MSRRGGERRVGFEGLQAGRFELFALETREERGEELQVFEGVLGGVKDCGGLFAKRCGDDACEMRMRKKGVLFPRSRPKDGGGYAMRGSGGREPAKPWLGELIAGFGPLGEGSAGWMPTFISQRLACFAQDGDVFAKVKAGAKFGEGGVAF